MTFCEFMVIHVSFTVVQSQTTQDDEGKFLSYTSNAAATASGIRQIVDDGLVFFVELSDLTFQCT